MTAVAPDDELADEFVRSAATNRSSNTPSAPVLTVIVGGLFVLGGLYFVKLRMFNRDVLETVPGELNVFKH
ncbi:hypothetical protein H7I77_21565 [Mycolicibacterium novocastrense]|uniref:Amino acid transporter n=1 Tax=Mycolicibacterium novocastrense TaxID=59813 RepID=A0AAW5SR32_MYCNV|nr:hypothetical protein [Mycolicibacterium novocastrense]MCV7025906.1 hypothetical protein [Mycolicibacterium novocastrense]GAT08383.1 amino acid transporter [Mycolicibacterium novocastrense]